MPGARTRECERECERVCVCACARVPSKAGDRLEPQLDPAMSPKLSSLQTGSEGLPRTVGGARFHAGAGILPTSSFTATKGNGVSR